MTKRTTNIFFSADYHIGHHNVINFDNRPFRDINHMHEVLINNYNASVGDNDVCYFLGDMGICKSDDMIKVISRLNGTKILLLGNHDKGVESMYKKGFDVVLYSGSFYIGDDLITMSHCPLKGVFREKTDNMKGAIEGDNWHREKDHGKFSMSNMGQFHIHGHCHKSKKERELGRQLDVGVRAWDYHPVSISMIEKWVAKVKRKENSDLVKQLMDNVNE